MAAYYVWHAAVGAGTGADWANAFIRLNTAMTGRAAGDVFYVAHDHTETAAVATTYTSPGTELAPCFVYCVNRAGSVPPVAADLRTTAQIITTATSNLTLAGMVRECYGIIFSAGTGAVTASVIVGLTQMTWRLVNCALRIPNTGGSSRVSVGVAGAYTVLENCTVQFANIAQGVTPLGRVSIRGPDTTSFITGATIPTNLFLPGTTGSNLFIEGVDLSAIATASKNLFINTATASHYEVLKDCKLGVAGDVLAGTIVGTGALDVTLIRCDEGDKNYRTEKYNRCGTQTTETLVVRSGSATDGTTPISYKLTEGFSMSAPFEALPISIWNETVGSPVTITLHAVSGPVGAASIKTNKEIWMDVEYLGTSGFPIGSRVSTGVASWLEAATSYSASTATWGGTSSDREDSSRFYMSVTVTPEEKGPITIYIMTATYIDGGSVFIDPKPVLS